MAKLKFVTYGRVGIVLIIIALLVSGYFLLGQRHRKITVSPVKVVIAEPTQPGAGLVYIASSKGYFKNEGLEVMLQPHTSGKAALSAVLEGKADLAVVAETPIMFTVMRGEKILTIATIFTSDKNMAVIARKDRGISIPSDLKGKKIGVSVGTNGEFFMDTFLILNGIPEKEIIPVNLKPEEMFDSVIKDEVDAVSTWHPHLIRLQKRLLNNGITFYGEGIYTWTFNIAAMQAYVRENTETIKKILRALIRAERFIRENPDESLKIIASYIKMDEGQIKELWSFYRFGITLDQSLLINLENQSRWAIKDRLTKETKVPNYLNFIYLNGLESVNPEAVTIIRWTSPRKTVPRISWNSA